MATDAAKAISKLQWDKKLLERPEGKLALAAFVLLGAGLVGVTGYFLVPIVTTILWNIFNLAIASAAVGALALAGPPLAKQVFKWNERLWRKVHEWGVKIDPIGAMHEYLNFFQRRMDVTEISITSVTSVRNVIRLNFQKAQIAARQLVDQWNAVKDEPGMEAEQRSVKRSVNRATSRLQSLEQQIALMDRFVRLLQKYLFAVKDKHLDIKEQIEEKESQYEMALKTQDAVDAMRAVFNTGSDEAQDFALALETADKTWADAIAGAEMFELETQEVFTKIRIDDLDAQKNGAAKLDELERMLDKGIFTKTRIRTDESSSPTDEEIALMEQAQAEVNAPTDFMSSLYRNQKP